MTAREAAVAVAVIKALTAAVKRADVKARTEVRDHLDPGDRKRAVLPDGTDVGTVSVTVGSESLRVVDDAAFLAWVKEHAPSEVVESVRDSYKRQVLAAAKDSGVIPDGVEPSWGDPTVTVRQSDEQAAAVEAAWRDGRLALPGLPQIEAGGRDAA